MIKKIVLLTLLLVGLANADSLIVNVKAKSDHLIKGDFNEDNYEWIGLGYRFIEEDKYSIQIEGAKFINSYYKSIGE